MAARLTTQLNTDTDNATRDVPLATPELPEASSLATDSYPSSFIGTLARLPVGSFASVWRYG